MSRDKVKWLPAAGDVRGADEASALFKSVFGYEPVGVWAAPGRVNIIGEHVDYNGGTCLPTALPHAMYAAVAPREDSIVRIVTHTDGTDIVERDLNDIGSAGSANAVKGWAGYPIGTAFAFAEATGHKLGMDIATFSCVPLGAGLSSSAAFECCVVVAADDLAGTDLLGSEAGRTSLVAMARRAENEIVGANTGGLDQSASVHCQAGHALLLDCRDMSVAQTPFDLAASGATILVVDTRAPHQLVDGQYGQRRADCEVSAKILGVNQLVDVDDFEGAMQVLAQADLPEVERQRLQMRTRHVLSEIARTELFVEKLTSKDVLSEEDLRFLGILMNDSHDSLRDDYEVTCPELDCVVDIARACGAYGARMTGGGFGGSAIALVKVEQAEAVACAIACAFEARGFNAPQFVDATPSSGARRVR